MPHPNRTALVVCVLFAILIYHVAIAWQDFAVLACNGFLYDDSFYAFKIAQNIAAGNGLTFDGVHSTTGFQPLYVFLLVPIFLLTGENLLLPIYLALTLLSVFTFLTAYLLYRICRRYVGQAASITAAAIWAFSPIVVKQGANGLETAIASFMIALTSLYYLEKVRSEEKPHARRFLILGLLLGATVLTRIDGIFLVLVILLDLLLLLRKRKVASRSLVRLALVPLGVLIIYGPWLLVSMAESGSPLQDSGTATRFISLAYAPYFGYSTDNLAIEGPNAGFIWTHVAHSASVMRVMPPVHVFFRSVEKLGGFLGAAGIFNIVGNIVGVLALLAVVRAVIRWRRQKERSGRGEVNFLLLFCLLLIISYSLYIFGAYFFCRYYYPIYLVSCIFAAFLLQDFFNWLRRRSRLIRGIAIFGCAFYVVLFLYFSFSQAFRSVPSYPFYEIAKWVETNTVEDDTVGAFQCGTIGYLSNRKVINLDGKVNRMALDALKQGCLQRYVHEEGIDVVLDHLRILELFLGVSSEEWGGPIQKVNSSSSVKVNNWVAFRCDPSKKKEDIRQGSSSGSAASIAPLWQSPSW